jgi:hypothetical protein
MHSHATATQPAHVTYLSEDWLILTKGWDLLILIKAGVIQNCTLCLLAYSQS